MKRTIIRSDRAPGAVGPYSQAVASGGLIFCSGQIPFVPGTKEFIAGGVEEQATQCLDNLSAVLEEAGGSLATALKVTIYLTDMADFGAVNAVYAAYFTDEPPARLCVEVSALPLGARIEIDAIGIAG
ncbi:MAG: RidA family protein [Spirochaetia bacterium]|nr:RidA family protein [Spirochaetia bacterium]MCF7942171.1 RidA family protein [Spirochaetia bacterium]